MNSKFLAMVGRKYGDAIRRKCVELAGTEEFSNASDVYVLDRTLYQEHKAEIEAADAEASLPFLSE